jgi:hypothetical protein
VHLLVINNQLITQNARFNHKDKEILSLKTCEVTDIQKLREADYIWRARLFKRFCATVCRDEVDALLNYFTDKACIY